MNDPIEEQEGLYRFPYHWFPEQRLKKFERQEKQRLIYGLIESYTERPIGRYLDIGCGDGRWTSDIHSYLGGETDTIGIDFSERAIGFAKLISPDIDFRVHRGEEIPFSANHFDLITAIEVIEHVEDNAEERFLREVCRVLQPDGLFILTTPSWNLRLTRHHFRHYSVQRLEYLLTLAGLHVVAKKGQSLPCNGPKRKIRKRMNLFPLIWKLWQFSYREVSPDRALNLLIASRPA